MNVTTRLILAAGAVTACSGTTHAQSVITRHVIASGGGLATSANHSLGATIGQSFAGTASSATHTLAAGFWFGRAPASCYPNCDGSTVSPILNVVDFICFQNRFAAADSYANCDGSSTPPALNVADFICFLNAFAAGCS